MRAVWLVLLALLCQGAVAQSTVYGSGASGAVYGDGYATIAEPGGGRVPLTFVGRTLASGSGGAVTVTETETGITLGGRTISAAVARSISMPEIASATAAVGAAFYGGCAVGTAIANYAGMGSQPANGSRVSCNVTEFLFDSGQSPVTQQQQQWKCNGGCPGGFNDVGTSGNDEAARLVSYLNRVASVCSGVTKYSYVLDSVSGDSSGVIATIHQWCGSIDSGRSQYVLVNTGTVQVTSCPASIDALNPAFNIAAGGSPGPDGKCATGRYNHMDPSAVATRLAQYGAQNAAQDMLKYLLDNGQNVPTAAPRVITTVTPTTVPLAPITSSQTNPDGSTTTTTKTPTLNYTPNGDTITYTTTYNTVTQTCTGAGSCSNTSNTTTTPSTTAPSTDNKTDCDKHPTAIGCSEFGDPGTAAPTWQQKQIDYQQEDLGFAGACPAPVHWVLPVSHYALDWSYQPACDIAPYVRAGILALAGLGALLFVIQTVKT